MKKSKPKGAPKSAPSVLDTVKEWEAGVDRYFTRETGGYTIDLNLPKSAEDVFFIRGAEARMTKSAGDYWRAWAGWVLSRAGLPAPEDFGERSWTRIEGGHRMTATFGDTPATRLHRVIERFAPDSAEACAARIEWRFLIGTEGGGEAEVARFEGWIESSRQRSDAAREPRGFKKLLKEELLAKTLAADPELEAKGPAAIARRIRRESANRPNLPTQRSLEVMIGELLKERRN